MRSIDNNAVIFPRLISDVCDVKCVVSRLVDTSELGEVVSCICRVVFVDVAGEYTTYYGAILCGDPFIIPARVRLALLD
jgi:hypothetical protein